MRRPLCRAARRMRRAPRRGSPQPRASLEALARHARYAALADAAREAGAAVVALAHHRNDQAETLLLQLLRGAGPHGLAAMPRGAGTPRALPGGARCWRFRARASTTMRANASCAGSTTRATPTAATRATPCAMPSCRRSPRIAPQADATLARVAAHQAEAARLMDELALQDAKAPATGPRCCAKRSTRWRRIAPAISCAGSCAARDSPRRRPRGWRQCSTSFAARAAMP